METAMIASEKFIDTGLTLKEDPLVFVESSGKLAEQLPIPEKRFCFSDLSNIRKGGRSFSIYGRYL